MERIDIHSHVVPSDVFGKAGRHGPDITQEPGGPFVMRIGSFSWALPPNMSPESLDDPAIRIEGLDSRGVDMAGISVTPPFYLYNIEPDLAASFSAAVNDSMAKYCSAYPDRLFFMATVPLGQVDAAVAELQRANGLGARGVSVGYNPCGRSLASEYFWPFYEAAETLGMPLFMHPEALGQDSDNADKSSDDDERYDWHSLIGLMEGQLGGFLYGDTVSCGLLMLGGVFDSFPNLNVCITHGGGAIPYQFGRFEYAARIEPSVRCKKPLAEYLPNFYFDTIVHELRSRQFLVDYVGADNVVVGSNFPGWDGVNGFEFAEELDISRADKDKIMGGNAKRIFRL
jgi:aminocarboxymuconate-semialdehyde decarboxylase